MKKLITLISACLLTGISYAGELSKADQKWSEAVQKMIAAGAATISTPVESRAKLAKELADKRGRESKVEKTDKGYRIVVQAAKP